MSQQFIEFQPQKAKEQSFYSSYSSQSDCCECCECRGKCSNDDKRCCGTMCGTCFAIGILAIIIKFTC